MMDVNTMLRNDKFLFPDEKKSSGKNNGFGQLLVKRVDTNKKYNMQETIPYTGAKPMYFVDNVDNKELLRNIVNKELLRNIVLDTCNGLKK